MSEMTKAPINAYFIPCLFQGQIHIFIVYQKTKTSLINNFIFYLILE